jgi:hypothetical protein
MKYTYLSYLYYVCAYIIIYHHISALISVVSGIFLSKQSIGESPSVAVCHLFDVTQSADVCLERDYRVQ